MQFVHLNSLVIFENLLIKAIIQSFKPKYSKNGIVLQCKNSLYFALHIIGPPHITEDG